MADHASYTLQVRGRRSELRGQLVTRQAGRQLLRIEVGGDENECVVVYSLIRRRARAGILRDTLRTLAADIFVAFFAHLAFGEAGDRGRDTVGNPVIDATRRASLWVDH